MMRYFQDYDFDIKTDWHYILARRFEGLFFNRFIMVKPAPLRVNRVSLANFDSDAVTSDSGHCRHATKNIDSKSA